MTTKRKTFIPDHRKYVYLSKTVTPVAILDPGEPRAELFEDVWITKIVPWRSDFDLIIIDWEGEGNVETYLQKHFDELWLSPEAILKE